MRSERVLSCSAPASLSAIESLHHSKFLGARMTEALASDFRSNFAAIASIGEIVGWAHWNGMIPEIDFLFPGMTGDLHSQIGACLQTVVEQFWISTIS